jgi:hypothetical protein
VIVTILGLYTALKILNYKAKDRDSLEIDRLKGELLVVRRQRDWFALMRELIAKIVDAKMMRIRKAWKEGGLLNLRGMLEALDPAEQIQQILIALHRTYARRLPSEGQLRLAVYLKDGDMMKIMFGWNGEKQNCFSGSADEFMAISDPSGAQSLIMDLYHGQKTFRIVPDCEEAVKAGAFTYFVPKQKDYLKSMVAMKKVVHTDRKDIIILTLDASIANFFSEEEKDDIELCCAEILKRLEFELLLLSIVNDPAFQSITPTVPKPSETSNTPIA